MSIHVVLYQPEIPSNTGNIARTCAGTDSTLHLIGPLGFSKDNKYLKRAGLDYWEYVKIVYYDSLDEFFEKNAGGQYFYVTKCVDKPYSSFDYSNPDKDYYFIFGSESTGLPKDLLRKNQGAALRIPMKDNAHSLNLSNMAAILVYEALRQQNYTNLNKKGPALPLA